MPTSLLDTVNSPDELRTLSPADLPKLANELREFLVNSVGQTGGHLASNLGTVELTIALHYVFDTPRDRIVWDVGHQTYAHKILTGRRAGMAGLRQPGGIAGFPRRAESAFDAFGAGHSSTSISAALGMAEAFHQLGSDQRAVAIIGDGAMTAGMAFEALNNAGATDLPLLVVLNDNDMSISPNVGALNNYLARLMSGKFYAAARRAGEKVLSVAPPIRELAKRAEEHMKGMVTPGTLFEEFGFNYIGPIDGHDLDVLLDTLSNIKQLNGPQFLHVVTRKGKGYAPAEANPCLYHGVSRFDPAAGVAEKTGGKPTYTQVFSDWLCDMAAADTRLVGITPAMREGSGLVRFSQDYPKRYFDVGIAEQHALTFAAGLACEGIKPVVAIYSTFLQRAYDQLIHDVALQNLPVMLAIDRAGLVGADGPTHAGSFDLSFLRCVPNMLIAAPSDENECRALLTTAFLHEGPAAVRYPRGSGVGATIDAGLDAVEIGRGVLRRRGHDVALIAFGSLVAPALQAAEALDASVADMRFVKPLDLDLLRELAHGHRLLVTLEENVVAGGAGAGVAEALAELGVIMPILHLGLPDTFIEHGDPTRMLADCGLDAAGIEHAVRQRITLLPE
ncbi:MAG: 1-deoxy-D-xylulose-5-phosphate synthase [Thiobacillus sp.]|uniref:1-deoxy-D-xylulose-5-phosphate synthase n=1 Tax=unclassified Thiobacillus TaxID=2646513 RepID=UPI00086A4F76|nr:MULTISPECIES: 1-deoxy-D-xylulose-5-phosphate synthase [unclassified Thiobacillus]MBN8772227.1 1-deoxy-D-xylulose-5-phosphate synthase [Thiobacillus sp.]ODV03017.1 MAG: 1-deoxy-D-xylulose-5-phosphate synthase [Thiobacillus sp. SCN 63-57]OJY55578.1 MAG: 1-deoxy-D-xylulose-5-phosphate synthase [Thiobacillus sp. 0-1251]